MHGDVNKFHSLLLTHTWLKFNWGKKKSKVKHQSPHKLIRDWSHSLEDLLKAESIFVSHITSPWVCCVGWEPHQNNINIKKTCGLGSILLLFRITVSEWKHSRCPIIHIHIHFKHELGARLINQWLEIWNRCIELNPDSWKRTLQNVCVTLFELSTKTLNTQMCYVLFFVAVIVILLQNRNLKSSDIVPTKTNFLTEF